MYWKGGILTVIILMSCVEGGVNKTRKIIV